MTTARWPIAIRSGWSGPARPIGSPRPTRCCSAATTRSGSFDAADSGSVTVTTVTDRMGTALRIPRQGSATVLFLGRSVAVLG